MVKIKCFVYHYALNWLKTWFTCCVHLTKVVHFGISLIRFAPIYVQVDLSPPSISITVGSTGPLCGSCTTLPSAPGIHLQEPCTAIAAFGLIP